VDSECVWRGRGSLALATASISVYGCARITLRVAYLGDPTDVTLTWLHPRVVRPRFCGCVVTVVPPTAQLSPSPSSVIVPRSQFHATCDLCGVPKLWCCSFLHLANHACTTVVLKLNHACICAHGICICLCLQVPALPAPEGSRLLIVHVMFSEVSSSTEDAVAVVFRAIGAGAAGAVPLARKADYTGEAVSRSGAAVPLWTLPGLLPVSAFVCQMKSCISTPYPHRLVDRACISQVSSSTGSLWLVRPPVLIVSQACVLACTLHCYSLTQ
jgi:hypothetical protein